jgi:glutamate dehydrogenase (NADP+)
VQNRSGLYWSLEEVNQRLRQKMIEETEKIWSVSQELAISMRTAAYVHALNRLGEARKVKGTRDYYVNGKD